MCGTNFHGKFSTEISDNQYIENNTSLTALHEGKDVGLKFVIVMVCEKIPLICMHF